MEADQLCGLTTGIGSLPYTDPAEAWKLITAYLPEVPHWPQLPRRSPAEGFVAQYLDPLLQAGLVTLEGGAHPRFATELPGWEERCSDFLEAAGAVEEGFAVPRDSAAALYTLLEGAVVLPAHTLCLKGQVSGPVTVGFQVTGEGRRPAFYDDLQRELITRALAGQARWQCRRLAELGYPPLIFVDDPGLYSYGSSSALALGRREIQASLADIVAAIHGAGGMAGVHCCAGVDWSLLLELPLQVVSFDAYEYLASLLVYAESVDNFLERGGLLAWGVVPTSGKIMAEEAGSLKRRLEEGMKALVKHGVRADLVRTRCLITPSCGTGTLTVEQAERVYCLTKNLGTGY